MKKPTFWLGLLLLNMSFILLKIFQHNRHATLLFDRQRLETRRDMLVREKDRLLADLYHKKDQQIVARHAKDSLQLQPLKLQQIIHQHSS